MKLLTGDDLIRPTLCETKMSGDLPVKAHCLPFAQIPHSTRLFLDFLSRAPGIQHFFPRSPYFNEWMKDEASALRHDSARRERVSSILERQNKSWDASLQTLANVERLRKGALAVVTGQQVGLFGGPMFAMYKALTTVKLAQEATTAGIDTVPVFWLATSDHDLAEVNHVFLPGPEGVRRKLSTPSHGVPDAPVSAVHMGDELLPVVEETAALLGDQTVTNFLRDSYRPGETLGTAFARLYAHLFAEWGVILLDASDGELHNVAAPIYRAAMERAVDLDAALLERGRVLEAAGYHQQVKVTPSSVLLFALHAGARTPIHRSASGQSATAEFVIGHEAGKIPLAQLLERITSAPDQFSPNVLLRPVVQDYLLPTLAYTGGAAETAYFAQSGAVYEMLMGRITPIVPRFSATIVEPKLQRLLKRYGVTLLDVFRGPDTLRQTLAARTLPPELQAAFEAANQSLDKSLAAIRYALEKLDPTLAEAAQNAGAKMRHQLEALHTKAGRAELRQSELIGRHAETLSEALYPDKGLQERGIAGVHFIARYGADFLQQIYESIHTDCHDHQILEV
jgi:bacillithiol biosynthesis cysteine-adding enzyme BshC